MAWNLAENKAVIVYMSCKPCDFTSIEQCNVNIYPACKRFESQTYTQSSQIIGISKAYAGNQMEGQSGHTVITGRIRHSSSTDWLLPLCMEFACSAYDMWQAQWYFYLKAPLFPFFCFCLHLPVPWPWCYSGQHNWGLWKLLFVQLTVKGVCGSTW